MKCEENDLKTLVIVRHLIINNRCSKKRICILHAWVTGYGADAQIGLSRNIYIYIYIVSMVYNNKDIYIQRKLEQ